MNAYNEQLKSLFEPYDEIVALWEDETDFDSAPSSLSSPSYRSYIAVADSEFVRDMEALRHELIMRMTLLDAETNVISNLLLVEPMFAPPTLDMGDADFLIRRWGYETPDTAVRRKDPYEPYIDELMERESLIADILVEHPDKLSRVVEFSVERCSGVLDGYEPVRAAHEQWDLLLRKYSSDMILAFLRSPMPRHRDIVLASPFIALYDELFERWLDDEGNVRKLSDVVPGMRDGECNASGLADVLAAVDKG